MESLALVAGTLVHNALCVRGKYHKFTGNN